jgi:hypothetical protein
LRQARGAANVTPHAAQPTLDQQQTETLSVVLDQIVPPGDDGMPGAVEVGALEAVERLMAPSAQPRALVAGGLTKLDQAASRWNRSRYVELTAEQQRALLRAVQAGEAVVPDWSPGSARAFFELLRRVAVEVYAAHPRVWAVIGYPGPSCLQGGYPDHTEPPG